MTTIDSRDSELKNSFNDFWSRLLGEGNYYDRLSLPQFIELKRALSDINNIITLKTTISFLKILLEKGVLSMAQYRVALAAVNDISANANGYDVELSDPKIVAEVKCNIPITGTSFGAAQMNGIMKDIRQMWRPTEKRKSDAATDNGYLRFMVMLDCDGVKTSMQKIIKNACKEGIPVIDECEIKWASLSTNCIYVVYIPVNSK